MSKVQTRYVCQTCGAEQMRQFGRCPECDSWGSLILEESAPVVGVGGPAAPAEAVSVAAISSQALHRGATGIGEFDRVLGGGIVPGSVVLIAGDPGIGKSTLLLQVGTALAAQGDPVLYATGEESLDQVRLRSARLGPMPEALLAAAANQVDAVEARAAEVRPRLLILDSIQTAHDPAVEAAPGSVTQVRQAAARLMRFAKESSTAVFLVGHVTKEGAIAGPRLLEHMVDTVLYLEGDRQYGYRLLRCVKNRFGSTEELGVFEMTGAGLREVANPSLAFLHERRPHVPGSAVVAVMEGSRPLLIEVQALVSPAAPFGAPRRSATGVDYGRACLVVAVLEKRGRLPLGQHDVFINVPGGVRVTEPAADLGIALAAASSLKDMPVRSDTVVCGEVGLTGEVRGVPHLARRLGEAARLGFRRCLIAPSGRPENTHRLEVAPVADIGEASDAALESH
ncbi:DNA repair protein RadA [candidate division KD3-62 bacterium DG_56]|uniref:DNA repair protein RadA n=1 Tax=candidate division KD3-62 bacterium DG_56 TaxID=1704032 RepID=A0A0S7XPK5_9BACT|nr:MAG: DNA repair protein RadA [candidate division KD3-62 bacterium DG_56]